MMESVFGNHTGIVQTGNAAFTTGGEGGIAN